MTRRKVRPSLDQLPLEVSDKGFGNPLFDPSKLELARRIRRMPQQTLASHLGVTRAMISQYESGESVPSGPRLKTMPQALRFPLDFFRQDGSAIDLNAPVFLRTVANIRARTTDALLGRLHLINFVADALEVGTDVPPHDIPHYRVDEDIERSGIEEIAALVRRDMSLPNGPIINCVETVERYRVVVARSVFENEDLDAFSTRLPNRAIIVLGQTRGDKARARFNVCHELGHLVMHVNSNLGHKLRERQANQFAASFLMPREEILEKLPEVGGQTGVKDLFALKRTWMVSLEALTYRALELEKISSDQCRRMVSWIRQNTIDGKEPLWNRLGADERPTYLAGLVARFSQQGYSLDDLAQQASLDFKEVVEILESAIDVDLAAIVGNRDGLKEKS